MSRTHFIEHKGRQILLMDFAGVADIEEGLGHIAEARKIVSKQPKKSLLTLVDVGGSNFNTQITNALRELSAHNKPYVIANAMVGVSGLKGMLVTTIARLSGRKLVVLPNFEAAKEWLIQQV